VPLAELICRGLTGAAPPCSVRRETPDEVAAKVATAREVAEPGTAVATEGRQVPA
jgi:hypothetical protein